MATRPRIRAPDRSIHAHSVPGGGGTRDRRARPARDRVPRLVDDMLNTRVPPRVTAAPARHRGDDSGTAAYEPA
jgi:hypothetical protein